MMLIRTTLLGLLALNLNSIHAEARSIPNAYYRILSPSGAEESYILGTMHAPVDLSEFGGQVEKQIASSKSVSVERVLQPADVEAYASDPITSLAKMAVFSGPPVDSFTRNKLIEYGIPAGVASRVSDSTCGVLGVVGQIEGKTLPLDVRVMQVAHRANVPVRALDTDAMRNEARARENASGESCSLKALFSEHSVAELRAALTQNAASSLADYRAGAIDDEETLNSPLVVSRNLAWMPAVTRDLQAGRAFIAVGQSHLFGHNGVLALLQRRGYTVQEVKAQDAPAPLIAPTSPGAAR